MKAPLLAAACLFFAVALGRAQEAEINDFAQVLDAIPKDVMVGLHTSKKDAAVTQATDALRDKVRDKVATFKCKVDRIEKDLPGPDKRERYRIKADDTRLNKGSTPFLAYLWVHFTPDESPKIAALKKGAQVTVTGKIATPFISTGTPLKLHVDLADAKLD